MNRQARSGTSLTIKLLALLVAAQATSGLASAQQRLQGVVTEGLLGRLQDSAENSLWQWGTLRVQPSLGLGSLNYVDNVLFGEEGEDPTTTDVTTTIFAGLNLYQLIGDRLAFGFSVEPSYVWWRDLSERRRFNTSFRGAAAARLNRVFFDFEVDRIERQLVATEELEQLVNGRTDRVSGQVSFRIYRSLAAAVGYRRTETENLLDEEPRAGVPDFTRLDATVESTEVGLIVEPGRNTTLFVGYVESDREARTTDRDYEGEALRLRLTVNRPGVSAYLELDDQSLEPVAGSSFLGYDDLTGTFGVRLADSRNRSITFIAERSLTPSVVDEREDFEATRLSIQTRVPLTNRLALFAGYQQSDRDLRLADRTDESRISSAGVDLNIARSAALSVLYERSQVDSVVSALDRDVNQFRVRFRFGLRGLSWP